MVEWNIGASIASWRSRPQTRWARKKSQRPLVLLVAARGAERQHGPAVAQRQGRRERRPRPRAADQRRRQPCSSQNICARVPRQSRARDRRRALQPAAAGRRARPGCRSGRRRRGGRCRRASARPRPPRRRRRRGSTVARPSGPGRSSPEASAAITRGAMPRRRARAAAPAAPAPSRRTRPPGRRTRASRPRSPRAGARRRGTGRVERVEQRQLLQQHRPLAPRPGLEHRPAAEVAADPAPRRRRPRSRPPGRPGVVERPTAVDRLGDEAAVPGVARRVDPRLARRAADRASRS